MLKALKYYLGLIRYFRTYIYFYVKLLDLLYYFKTNLLKNALMFNQQRQAFASKIKLGPSTFLELLSFQSLQKALFRFTTLKYYNLDKILQIDLNVFKKFGFETIVFYIKNNNILPKRKWLSSTSIRPVLFFFKLMISVKKNYQFTKLEIASFIWVLKKILYIIKLSKIKIII